jgi:methyl-accepting chemotaxis protein
MDKTNYISVPQQQYESSLHIPPWVMPVGSILFSVIATSVTVTIFLNKLQNRIDLLDEAVKGKFTEILLKLQFKEENFEELKFRVERMESNFQQLVRYVNNKYQNHSFTPRNDNRNDLDTMN